MHQFIGLAFSLISLGLLCAIYQSVKPSEKEGWLNGETFLSALVAVLTGFFTLAIAILAKQVWLIVSGETGPMTVLAMGADALNFAAIVASFLVFRALSRLTAAKAAAAGNVSPFPTRPVSPQPTQHTDKKAA